MSSLVLPTPLLTPLPACHSTHLIALLVQHAQPLPTTTTCHQQGGDDARWRPDVPPVVQKSLQHAPVPVPDQQRRKRAVAEFDGNPGPGPGPSARLSRSPSASFSRSPSPAPPSASLVASAAPPPVTFNFEDEFGDLDRLDAVDKEALGLPNKAAGASRPPAAAATAALSLTAPKHRHADKGDVVAVAGARHDPAAAAQVSGGLDRPAPASAPGSLFPVDDWAKGHHASRDVGTRLQEDRGGLGEGGEQHVGDGSGRGRHAGVCGRWGGRVVGGRGGLALYAGGPAPKCANLQCSNSISRVGHGGGSG